jgi:hypothetical protein
VPFNRASCSGCQPKQQKPYSQNAQPEAEKHLPFYMESAALTLVPTLISQCMQSAISAHFKPTPYLGESADRTIYPTIGAYFLIEKSIDGVIRTADHFDR